MRKQSEMSRAAAKKNRSGQLFDNNSNEMPDPHLLSPNSSMRNLDVSSASDNESWASEDSYPEELTSPPIQWKSEIPWTPDRRRSSIKKPQFQLDPVALQLNEFYENRVRTSLERKEICEEIAYNAIHKCFRKIQMVDNRFRANSLVSQGIPYDGLQAEEPIQMDMLVQLSPGTSSAMYTALDERTGGIRVQPSSEDYSVWEDCITTNGFLAAGKINSLLRKYVKKAVKILNAHMKDGRTEKLPKQVRSISIEKGPVIRVIINKDISVDILPAFVIPDSRSDPARRDCPSSSHVVCKPYIQNEMIWRLSFYVAEKNRIRALSEGCRIQLLRILTEIRDNEDQLKRLSSYHVKTLLFHESDKFPDFHEWSADKITRRFFGLLERLKTALKEGNLPHYFMQPPDFKPVNLFADLDGKTLSDMLDVIEDIMENPMGILRTAGRERRQTMWPWEMGLFLPAGITS